MSVVSRSKKVQVVSVSSTHQGGDDISHEYTGNILWAFGRAVEPLGDNQSTAGVAPGASTSRYPQRNVMPHFEFYRRCSVQLDIYKRQHQRFDNGSLPRIREE